MEKIRELLQTCGLSQEAANKICESLDDYVNTKKQQLEETFKQRLANAKKVCMEQTEQHINELTRRLQIFLEAKSSAIEEQMIRKSQNRGTVAEAKLNKVLSILEGTNHDSEPRKAEIDNLKKITEHLAEERNKAVKRATRMQEISERVLKRNRQLEKMIAEGVQKPTRSQPRATERVKSTGGKRQTTQPTLVENVSRKPAGKESKPMPISPEGIASQMDEEI